MNTGHFSFNNSITKHRTFKTEHRKLINLFKIVINLTFIIGIQIWRNGTK